MPKVSVIIPVYNVEKYLKECMDSVINQTLQDIEIICIDDGSTDNSGKMLDEYAARDNRIKVIHKENGGYGKAMNIGLDNATGEYIGIVEPDDYIELDMYETFYNKAKENNVDFIKGNYYAYSTTSTVSNELKTTFDKSKVYNKLIKPLDYLETFNGGACIWSAIYDSEFLKKHNIRFLETPGASFQDTSFWITILFEASCALFTEDTFNHYRIDNDNSSVKNNNKVYCICDELNSLENRYSTDKLKRKILNALKLDKYDWNYFRLGDLGQDKFYKVLKKEVVPILTSGNYEKALISEFKIKRLKEILNINKPQLITSKILKNIFSVRNNNEHKVITILGIKIKIRREKHA